MGFFVLDFYAQLVYTAYSYKEYILTIFINDKIWSKFTEDERIAYEDKVYKHYRNTGFPYFPTDREWRDKEYKKLLNYDFTRCIDYDNKIIRQTMHGLSLCWSYQPHHYDVQCNNMRTVLATFNDDDLLKGVIAKRVKHGSNMSDNGLRKMMKIYTGTQCVSNFRPTAAAAIYRMFTEEGDTVYDMSSGYGGRCLGAHLAGVHYHGVDPSTLNHNGVQNMVNDYQIDATLDLQGSEERTRLNDSSVDLCFTSPPYFDCEKYSTEDTQSYIKFPTKDLWLNGFLRDTLLECIRVCK